MQARQVDMEASFRMTIYRTHLGTELFVPCARGTKITSEHPYSTLCRFVRSFSYAATPLQDLGLPIQDLLEKLGRAQLHLSAPLVEMKLHSSARMASGTLCSFDLAVDVHVSQIYRMTWQV